MGREEASERRQETAQCGFPKPVYQEGLAEFSKDALTPKCNVSFFVLRRSDLHM